MTKTIKVLVVDDSALVRKILKTGLEKDPVIEVVGTANDPYMARDMIIGLKPDVLTLDVEMPKMDGVEFLKKLMPQYPLPVVMVSSLTQKGRQVTLDALDAGAVDFVSKPTADISDGLSRLIPELIFKVKQASVANVSHLKKSREEVIKQIKTVETVLTETTDKVIAIGASTGGTEAIREVVESLPATSPGIVIVQHMPPGFTKMYAERLNKLAAVEVIEGKTGDRIIPGRAIIAPGNFHMTVKRVGGQYQVNCSQEGLVNGHRPSVSMLFHSVAKHVGKNAVGIILTGMGGDGADGMLSMKKKGAFNIAQDEESSVIFGMPKVAIDMGGVSEVLPLGSVADRVVKYFKD